MTPRDQREKLVRSQCLRRQEALARTCCELPLPAVLVTSGMFGALRPPCLDTCPHKFHSKHKNSQSLQPKENYLLSLDVSQKYAESNARHYKFFQVGSDHVVEVISAGTSHERTDLETVVCTALKISTWLVF